MKNLKTKPEIDNHKLTLCSECPILWLLCRVGQRPEIFKIKAEKSSIKKSQNDLQIKAWKLSWWMFEIGIKRNLKEILGKNMRSFIVKFAERIGHIKNHVPFLQTVPDKWRGLLPLCRSNFFDPKIVQWMLNSIQVQTCWDLKFKSIKEWPVLIWQNRTYPWGGKVWKHSIWWKWLN